MKNIYKELREYLPGMTEEFPESFLKLAEIFRQQVFELYEHRENDTVEYRVPYMMNDALECFLILKHAKMTGEFLRGENVSACIAREGNVYILVVRQGEKNTFTIWFTELQEELHCYQYHRIGHFWVEDGEPWRRLMYIVGTIHDKYDYLGENACNEAERELMHLAEFAPLMRWSPVRESVRDWYPITEAGIRVMHNMAVRSGDQLFRQLLELYARFPIPFLEQYLGKLLNRPKREKLYEYIRKEIEKASSVYPERVYGSELDGRIRRERKYADRKLKAAGLKGEYPFYFSDRLSVLAVEEHPFTLMDSEDFDFRIQYMVSYGRKKKGCVYGQNYGFFRNRGKIETTLDFLARDLKR